MVIALDNFIDYESVETDFNVSPIQNIVKSIEIDYLNLSLK